MVVPAQPDVELFAEVSFEPDNNDSLSTSFDGDIALSLSDQSVTHGETDWFVLVTGDAWLSDPEIVEADGTRRDAPFTVYDRFSAADGDAIRIQVFHFSVGNQGRLVGRPQASPLSKIGDKYSLTMPGLTSLDPVSGDGRDGGVILGEQVLLPLVLVNPKAGVGDGFAGWSKPLSNELMAKSGLAENDSVTVTRSAPELDRDKWGQLIIWTSDVPFTASAIIEDEADLTSSASRSSWSFLFYGAALPLFIEAIISREPKTPPPTPPAPPVARATPDPPHVPVKPAATKKPQGKRRNRRRKAR